MSKITIPTQLEHPLKVGVGSSYSVVLKCSWVLQNHKVWAPYAFAKWMNQIGVLVFWHFCNSLVPKMDTPVAL